jgi:hypothetical protein
VPFFSVLATFAALAIPSRAAAFFFQCMEAIGCRTLRLHDDDQ